MLLLDSDMDMDAADEQDGAAAQAGAADGAADAAAGLQEPSERVLRLKQRKVFNLKRKYAELTAQVEGALCEVGGCRMVYSGA
jgi:hypothetical protein